MKKNIKSGQLQNMNDLTSMHSQSAVMSMVVTVNDMSFTDGLFSTMTSSTGVPSGTV